MFVLVLGRSRSWLTPVPIAKAVERMVSGGYGGGDIPVPIPNTAVKPTCADGTWGSPPGRVGRRRDFLKDPHRKVGVFRIVKCAINGLHSRTNSPVVLGLSEVPVPSRAMGFSRYLCTPRTISLMICEVTWCSVCTTDSSLERSIASPLRHRL